MYNIYASDLKDAIIRLNITLKNYGRDVTVRGLKTKELSPLTLCIKDPVNNNVITEGQYKHNKDYLNAEFSWYAEGRKDTEFIAQYASFWKQISIDGNANSAYGRWIFNEGVNQWERVYSLLKEDKDTRKAVIYLGDRNNFHTLDTICTNNLQFRIVDNKLELYVTMRSNDFVWGFRNDTFMFTMMQQHMAKKLGIDCGKYYLFTPSFHIYEKDFCKLCDDLYIDAETYTLEELQDNLILENKFYD